MKILATISILLIGCSGASKKQADKFEQLFTGEMQIIDLTYSLGASAPYWPNSENKNPFNYEAIFTHPSGMAVLGKYATPEHNGTHIDAPIHGGDNLATVDQISPEDFFAPLAVIDVREKCAANPDYGLTMDDILEWEERHGKVPAGAVVIMSTGWSEKWEDMSQYQNQDENGQMHFPGFTEEVNVFLVKERNIKGVGIDNLSIDPGAADGFPAHGITNGAGKYRLENVANVHLLPEAGAFIIVAPIKIEGGSGGQVRLFALIP